MDRGYAVGRALPRLGCAVRGQLRRHSSTASRLTQSPVQRQPQTQTQTSRPTPTPSASPSSSRTPSSPPLHRPASALTHRTAPTPTAPIIRLMVLETDRPHPDTYSERGSFGDILHDHLAKAGAAHHPPLGIETDQVFVVEEQGGRVPTMEEMEGFDGLLITGSMFDAHGDNEWILKMLALLKDLWIKRPDFHFTGVCFGHQLLARLLGAPVHPHPSGTWELGHSRINLTPTGQRLFRTRSPHVHLHQMHQDRVASVPTSRSAGKDLLPATSDGAGSDGGEVVAWGSSEHTPIQGLYLPNRLFTSQAHLAFDADMVKRQIGMRVDSGGIQDLDHARKAADTAHLEHDGFTVAAAILRLFSYDDDGMGYERR